MEIIKSVQIRKFRSLKSITRELELTHLNIFVGRNDQGKSNILRALNLFFNNETDLDFKFRFSEDYCYHSNTGKGTSREIRIDLVIHPPVGRFKHAKPLRWTKRWKQDGSIVEERKYIDSGETLSQRDNVSKWLDKIRYRYVPAIKGKEYFSSLMGELHDVLNEAHSEVLNAQGEDFISGIQEITEEITSELNEQIGISNTIQVPSDFRQLFSNLDFGAKVGENTFHLKQRGDGVKIRHIPIILKYMSEQERNISRAGYVKPDTIWGFEEPENNLELQYAFDLAEAFKQYSQDIQILVTTHSPAFYALDKTEDDGTNAFHIFQGDDGCTLLSKVTHDQTAELHETMGLLPIITPYLAEIYDHQQEIANLKDELGNLKQGTKCVILTEDENHEHVIKYFEINGFLREETEYFSYMGSNQIKGAIVLAKYLSIKDPDVRIVIHRDRDYLNEKEIDQIQQSINKHGFDFFVTKGVDVESQYLNAKHLQHLFPEINYDLIVSFLEEATAEAKEDSVNRLIDHYFRNEKPKNNAYAKKFKELQDMYDADQERFRYGKKVCGLIKSKIQQHLKINPDIFTESEHVKSKQLLKIARQVW